MLTSTTSPPSRRRRREASSSTLEGLLDKFLRESTSLRDQGDRFERLVRSFLLTDYQWAGRFDEVWMWQDWPGRDHRPDTGIDLVARERDTGDLVAVQCKFYDPQAVLQKQDIDSFLSESGKEPFRQRLIVTTTLRWGRHAEEAIHGQQIPVQRLDLTDLLDSSIDWSQFDFAKPEDLELKERKELRTHQRDALEAVRAGLQEHDRGKLIMACGTGKTFTSLRIAEELVPLGGSVLFLVPSIALLSQSLREWSLEAVEGLRTFAVCSDVKVGKKSDAEDISVVDLAIPATTNPATLHARMADRSPAEGRITVVFSTYQSIDVVAQAQAMGLPDFDLVVCDEAHRTTGATLAGAEESAWTRVHNPEYIRAGKRLYMTATPRIYDDASKAKAGQANAVLASMDDEALFGPELHRLGFGEAVGRDLLSDYKVLVLAVDEGYVSRTFQEAFTDPDNSELGLDDVAKIVGCWNGLAKRGSTEHDFATDPEPMRRAVAFSRSIKDSKSFAERFEAIVAEVMIRSGLQEDDPSVLPATAQHVDGTYNVLQRNERLAWLEAETPEPECRVLSNAKCLSEGVDVPALDAVLFLNPRKSIVDVVQSVGRVMRKAPGKKYGYIILPIGIPAGTTPEDALRDNEKYRVVWEVLQALRAHDERFDAMVNKIELNSRRDDRIQIIGVGGGPEGDEYGDGAGRADDGGTQAAFDLASLGEWRDAIYAKIVQKVGSRRYWEQWAQDVADIAEKHRLRLLALIDQGHAAEEFEAFLTALRANLNPSISRNDAIDMLSQHLITAPIFEALFAGYDFTTHNPVSQVMQGMLEALEGSNLEAEVEPLEKFYASVRQRAAGLDNAEARQKVVTELYEKFFRFAFPRVADSLGIVYTPVEIVDFILRSVDHLLRTEFGTSISAEGVHVLDPFTGTGTFLVRLLQSGLIQPHDLARKYASELHANEIMLLAYYIAAINIESTYHQLMSDRDNSMRSQTSDGVPSTDQEYVPFDGIVLTDTFQMTEKDDLDDLEVFTSNNARVDAQRRLDIRVIVGNPPYSVGQTSGNDNNQNVKYPTLDAVIERTYAARSTSALKKSLYDSYVRAIRWASDRIGDQGVIGFVTNGGFIDANTADGLRKTLADEFATIYVYNLRGNQRTAGEQARKEGGKIFGSGSRNTVAVTFLVKHPSRTGRATLRYRDIGDYLSREQKLAIVDGSTVDSIEWTNVAPNDAGDWTNQRSEGFDSHQPIGSRDGNGTVFAVSTRGLITARDAWVYNFSPAELTRNVERMIRFYNGQVDEFADLVAKRSLRDTRSYVNDFIDTDPRKFSWDHADRQRLPRGRHYEMHQEALRIAAYRPFTKQAAWFDRELNNRVYQLPLMFPTPQHPNHGFTVSAPGANAQFTCLAVDKIPDLVSVAGAGNPSLFFARYTYENIEEGELDLIGGGDVVADYRRIDNITDATLTTYRNWYGPHVTKDDVFAFVYGLLHSPDYRERFAADLKRTLPRIPRIQSDDFAAFRDAGQALLDLHIGYESVEPYPLTIGGSQPSGPGSADVYEWFRVEKMRYVKRGRETDRSTISYNPRITVSGVPDEAHRYMLGSRSAVDWILDRYQVRTDKASGIVNDPNDWSREVGNPRYILDLLARVVTVSVETMRLVDALPPLRIVEQA